MEMWITGYGGYGKRHSQHMEKLKCSFPTSCKQRFPQPPKKQPVTHIPTPPTKTEKDPFLSVIHKSKKE
jgi:hypothetical protein